MLTFLAGGVGAARLLAGVVEVVEPPTVTAIVNTGDDIVLHGLHISPDLDTVTYTLAGLDNQVTGWGMLGETWTTITELETLGGETWFRLGDRDLATHLYRTQRLSEGATLSEVTTELTIRRGVGVRLLPMSDDPVRTRIVLAGEGEHEVAFQHYFVRLAHAVPVRAIRFAGAETAAPAPGVLDAIATAETVVVCPSNPLVSIAPLLALAPIRDALAARRQDIVAVSPIVAGAALKGPADRLLHELGHESSVVGVARLYAPWVGALVIDEADAALATQVEHQGLRCIVAPTIMSDRGAAASLARRVLDFRG